MAKSYCIEKFFPSAEYVVENAYIYAWECDIFLQMKSGYHYEIEQKISRSDFKADFKKSVKHFQLQNSKIDVLTVPGSRSIRYLYPDILSKFDYDINPIVTREHSDGCAQVWISSNVYFRANKTPNRFYYITPKGLLDVKEIPKYAGLLEYSEGEITHVKTAPWLHKNKLNYDKILLDKYRWRFETLKENNRALKTELDKFRDIYSDPNFNQSEINF